MDKCEVCKEHSGHAAKIETLEREQGEMKKEVKSMKNWVIAGMTSLVMQLVLVIGGLAMYWVKSKAGI